ncbi:hypothetical protein MKX01_003403 [Papaver californicum]|nr:hypothetical protein MKX01_003403 [Papaver californicum]
MDRYFIGIMVDQVRKVNKSGNVFRKKAWLYYSIQNKARTLRILYLAMKPLLAKNEFHWDETQQMIAADDNVWDDYLKLHPEARPYRTKTLPNYYKLGIRDSKDQEVKNEVGPGGSHSPATSRSFYVETLLSTDRSKTNWTVPMDNFFIEIMIEHVNKGFKIGKTFHREAWLYMLELFDNKFGLQLDKEVSNRYKKLRTQYNAINVLLDNGFQWDEARQLVIADDGFWDDYLLEHPVARSYRTKTVPNYSSLCVIYGDSIPDTKCKGAGHHDNSKSVQIGVCGSQQYPLISSPCEDTAVDHMQEGPSDSDGGMDIIIGGASKRPFETPSTCQVSRKAQRSNRMCMLDAVRKMSVAVSRLTKRNESCVSLEIVRNALQATPDLEEDLLMDAIELLQDEHKANLFLALDVSIRKNWLLSKIGPPTVSELT